MHNDASHVDRCSNVISLKHTRPEAYGAGLRRNTLPSCRSGTHAEVKLIKKSGPVAPRALMNYLDQQLSDIVAMKSDGAFDAIGYKCEATLRRHLESRPGVVLTYLPYRGRPKALVAKLPGRLNQIWLSRFESEHIWRDSFRRFLAIYHGADVSSLGIYGYAIDHSYPRIAGTFEKVDYTRLLLVNSKVNSSWGNWEKNFAKNDMRGGKQFSPIQISHLLKLSNFHGPKLPVSETYIATAAKHLLDHKLLSRDREHPYNLLRILLHKGSHVPGVFQTHEDRKKAALRAIMEKMNDRPVETVAGWFHD